MIAAVIPTLYRPSALARLLEVLRLDGVFPIVVPSELFEHAIYRMWNVGAAMARAAGARAIAVLNDDIEIPRGALPLMGQALEAHPEVGVVYPDTTADWQTPLAYELQPTQYTHPRGGMTGFCFAFRSDLPVAFDERYHWWYGDDAFEEAVRAMGLRVCRMVGVPIRHMSDGSASRRWGELEPLTAQDRARWEAEVHA